MRVRYGGATHLLPDLSGTHVWEASSVAALDAVVTRNPRRGRTVTITGFDSDSARIHDRLAGELAGSH